mmetsp:Transcript_10511/g.21629  ORF Transcript_10511/g.21629 Transcript_10511/m.21629 type:complete len:110 (-) Transcript_10511:54-383(-)
MNSTIESPSDSFVCSATINMKYSLAIEPSQDAQERTNRHNHLWRLSGFRLSRNSFIRALLNLARVFDPPKPNCSTNGNHHAGKFVPFQNNTCYIRGEACDYECINELNL